jgi:CDP-glucose 4,6-dehydratase
MKTFNPDFIFHLAAQPLVIDSYEDPFGTNKTNFTGTLNLLEALRKHNKKIVALFVTTDKVYENIRTNKPFKESDKLGGDDPYSSSKAASEILIHSYNTSFFKKRDIRIVSARAGNVIGGGDWSRNRLIPDMVRAYKNRTILEIRYPKSVRPWQHVLDPLFGYLKLSKSLSEDSKFNGAWNFGPENGEIMTVIEVVNKMIDKGLNIPFKIKEDSLIHEASHLQLNIEKAKSILQWKPKFDSKTTIEKTVDWYKSFYDGVSANDLIKNDINSYLNISENV